MKYNQIIEELKNKAYHPVYLLTGEEPYYIDQIAGYIENHVLEGAEKEFNQTIIYGRDTNVREIIEHARQFPMMANYHVVIVKEAQDIKDIEQLHTYTNNPISSTILVICYKYKKIDKRKTFARNIHKKGGVLFESPRLYENKVPDWISSYMKERNYTITPQATILLAEYLGTSLSKIVNEINKLCINVPAGTEIGTQHIEENIGISKDFNTFELQNALGHKDAFKANRIINYFAANPKDGPMIMVLVLLHMFFVKTMMFHKIKRKSTKEIASVLSVHPFLLNNYRTAARNYPPSKIRDIFAILRTYDLRMKGVENANTPEAELMKEMVYKILH